MFGWKWKYPQMEWYTLSMDGYPGWEIEEEDAPAFVKLTHTRGGDGSDIESSELANGWDDIAKGHFYQRDWTDDGIPFVAEGDTYWSGWWFETVAERDRFVEWYLAQKTARDLEKNDRG